MRFLSIRNFPVLLLGAATVMLGLYTLYWYSQMLKFKAEIARMIDGDGLMFDVQAKQIAYSGFPYRLSASFDGAQLVRHRSDYVVMLETPSLDITRLLWAPEHMLLMANQPKLSFRSRGGSYPLKISFIADTMESSLRATPQKVERLSFEFRKVLWHDGHPLKTPISIADLQFHLRDSVEPSGAVARKSKWPVFANLRIMAGAMRSDNAPAVNVDMFADITGGDRLKDGAPALSKWQQRGGRLEVRSIVAARAGLTWSANGHLALDSDGTVAGSGMLHSNAVEATVGLLQGQTDIKPKTDVANDVRWQINGGMLKFDDVSVLQMPFQFIDAVGE
jgi:hypothetical protein